MGKTKIPMVTTSCAMILHPLWCYLFIVKMNLSISGAGLANTLTYIIFLTSNLIYTWCLPDIQQAVFMPDKRTFEDLGQFLKLGIPGVMMLCLDAYGNVLVNILSGLISMPC
jgi:Na+-driven multidrug efflux pump